MKTPMLDVSKVLDQAEKMPVEELRDLCRSLSRLCRDKEKDVSRKVADDLDGVRYVENTRGSKRLPIGARGLVTRYGSSKFTVDFGSYGSWRCPASMLRKSDDQKTKVETRPRPQFSF